MLIKESIHDLALKPKNELTRDEKQMLKAADRVKIAYQIWPNPEQKTIFWTNQYFLIIAALEAVMLILLWLGVSILWVSPLILTGGSYLFQWWRGSKKLLKRYIEGNYKAMELPNEHKHNA